MNARAEIERTMAVFERFAAIPAAYRDLEGVCAQTDPEAYYPEKGGSTREAKRVCWGCSERLECLKVALNFEEAFGVWGGMSERDRRILLPTWRKASRTRKEELLDAWVEIRTEKGLRELLKHFQAINEAEKKAEKEAEERAGEQASADVTTIDPTGTLVTDTQTGAPADLAA